MPVRVGVLLNPIAGFGGPLALHGTDGLAAVRFDEAVRANRCGRRMVRALQAFLGHAGPGAADCALTELVAAPGLLGARQLAEAGIPHHTSVAAAGELHSTDRLRTDRRDTIAAARSLVASGIDVLVFAGGDGTATDVAEAVGAGIPVIGIPSGVKMHSEVFVRSPESGGRLLADFVLGRTRSELAEVLDVGGDDESGVVGMLLAPRSREALQGAKASAPARGSEALARAIAERTVGDAASCSTWLIGPGRTAGAVAGVLGFTATLRGVDIRHPAGTVELDVDEERLFAVVGRAARPRLVLGVVGGQGFLLGRGNQQLSPRVIDRIGAAQIDIVASTEKIGGLFPPVLLVDAEEPSGLLGYRTVRTDAHRSIVMRVLDAAKPLPGHRTATPR